jgi:serine/threonine protein kinase
MAVVYRAVDSVLGRTVAVKVIRPAFTEDPQFLERFLQEARVVASLDHPNVLPIFDFGRGERAPYLVLPYLPGGSLADRMAGQPQPAAAGGGVDDPARSAPSTPPTRAACLPPRRQARQRAW